MGREPSPSDRDGPQTPMAAPVLLLVEDNADDEALIRRALGIQRPDVSLIVARDGRQALDLLQPPASAPGLDAALVILDLELPAVDGFEVLRCLRAQPATRRLPVAVLTASIREADRDRACALGADAYHRKPVEFRELMGIVEQLAARWLPAAPAAGGR